MTNAPSIGLIGIGGIGASHLESLSKLEKVGLVRLVAVADPAEKQLAEQIATLKSRGVRWYPAFDLMLDQEKLDAVVIATPIYFHAAMARACVARGLFVYLEKPPVPLIQQLEELIAMDRHTRVHVAFQMISSEFIQELKRAVVEGKLGAIREIAISACWPRTDSYYHRNSWAGKMALGPHPIFDGPATNALAHLIHNAMFLAGNSHQEFASLDEIQAELYRVRPIESYDLACLRGTFPSGIRFVAALTHATEEHRPFRLRIRGTKGWVEVSKDGAELDGSLGRKVCAEPFPDAFLRSYQNFVSFAQWPATRLQETRGYVKATNGAFISSGGIFTVDESYSRICENNGDRGYDLPGLPGLIDRSFEEGRLFSELGAPWAKPTAVVQIQNLSSIDILGIQERAGSEWR
jgi:predicted dehydrogenase